MLYKEPHFQRPFDTSPPTTFSWDRKAFASSAFMHAESFGKPRVRDGGINALPRTLAEAIDGVPTHFILSMRTMGTNPRHAAQAAVEMTEASFGLFESKIWSF
jgi:hypothetical protein